MMLWSCDPKDIKTWTEEEEQSLDTALGKIFSVKESDKPVDLDSESQ